MATAEEWEALLRRNTVAHLLGIDSLSAFEAYNSDVSRDRFVRTAVLRVLAFLLPEHDPLNDLQSWDLGFASYDLRSTLLDLMVLGFTAFMRWSLPPTAYFVRALEKLVLAYNDVVLNARADLSFMKDAEFKGQRVEWTSVWWPISEIDAFTTFADDFEGTDFVRAWLQQGVALDDAAILLGDPEHPLLTSMLKADQHASNYARLVWPYAMQHRLPVVVDECARVLPVIALPELVAEYVFGEAVRDWPPATGSERKI
jgi:hypothetical protein